MGAQEKGGRSGESRRRFPPLERPRRLPEVPGKTPQRPPGHRFQKSLAFRLGLRVPEFTLSEVEGR